MRAGLVLACILSGASSPYAQDSAKPTTEKWRPKDGPYASPGKDFNNQCGEYGDIVIEFADKSVSGHEWSCKVTKLTDTAPDAIRLNITCNDYNLAGYLFPKDPKADEMEFKEVLLLKKIDEKSMSVRKTLNGKFKDPAWRADYCPEEWQRAYTESRAREKAQAEQKAAEENPWQPQAGVYATPGTDFNDRCLKSGDAIIELSERSISSGAEKCNVTFIRGEINALQMFVTCSGTSSTAGDRTIPASPRPETVLLKKIDDKTVSLQMTRDRKFIDSGRQLSYCGQEAQKVYAQQKAKK